MMVLEETINMDGIDLSRRRIRDIQRCIRHLVIGAAGLRPLDEVVANAVDELVRDLESECAGLISEMQRTARLTDPPPPIEVDVELREQQSEVCDG